MARRRTTGPNETRIMLYILAQLSEKYPNSLFERQNVIAAQAGERFVKANKKGSADIRGCHKGVYLEIEVKRPGEAQTSAQRARQVVIRRAEGVYGVAHNLDEALAIVGAI